MAWLTPKEVPTKYPLTERHVRRMIFERRIAFSKVGGRVFINQEDLDGLFAAGRVEAERAS